MRIENGKLILEQRECFYCNGKKSVEDTTRCSNDGIPRTATYKHPCKICGSKTKQLHYRIPIGTFHTCTNCNGSGLQDENTCDYTPDGFESQLEIHLLRTNREMGQWEQTLGMMGSVFSCVDYGRHNKTPDDELIADVRKSCQRSQATKLIDKEMNILPIVIITGDQGYSVIKMKHETVKLLIEKGWMK
jgi:hypothetical protein